MYDNVRGRDRAEGESEDSTNDDFVTCQLVSLLTLRKMSLKSSQMSLNGRNEDRNRDRCHGIVEIVTEVLMVTVVPNTPDSSLDPFVPKSYR